MFSAFFVEKYRKPLVLLVFVLPGLAFLNFVVCFLSVFVEKYRKPSFFGVFVLPGLVCISFLNVFLVF